MNWPERNATVAKYHTDIINIIEQTPHNFTPHAAVAAKAHLRRHLIRSYREYLSLEETRKIDFCLAYPISNNVSLQFLMDLATHILYAKGIDVWEVIMTTERKEDV